MRSPDEPAGGIAVAAVVGTVAVVTPILTSIYLARLEGVIALKAQVRQSADEILRHTEESAQQNWTAYYMLKDDHLRPCSPAEIDLMRSIDMASPYVQAVGRIEADTLLCTSLGTTDPIPLGPAKIKTENGVDARTEIRLPIAGNHPLNILSKDGLAVLYDPMLFLDIPDEGRDISLTVFTPSGPHRNSVTLTDAAVQPEWQKSIPKGAESTFVDSGYIVSATRSRVADVEVVAAVPMSDATRYERQFAHILVPVGLLCGITLVWATLYVVRKRLSLASILRAGVRRREFYVEYEPIVELATQRWVGAEALVRWRRGNRTVRPDLFIPIAEATGLITGITQCVFEIVARDLPMMIAADPKFSVAINLSMTDLGNEETVALIQWALDKSRAQPFNITVEATERGFLKGDAWRSVVAAIRERGVVVAIDDFGTGYSSLALLQDLPLDRLKIDKSFVDTVGTDGVTSQVVHHIVELAQSLKLGLVAEGVGTEEQVQFLRERGVQYAQGWFFGKPMPVTKLCDILSARSGKHEEVAEEDIPLRGALANPHGDQPTLASERAAQS